MIASEADIIESFARHTLHFVDHLYIQFHNSYDSSKEIIEQLICEGLPISFEQNPDPGFRREAIGNELVHNLAKDSRFDFILPLDADEFIVVNSRSVLEDELETVRHGGGLTVNWLAYVPTEADNQADPNPITRIRHRTRSIHPLHKVFFAAKTLADDDIYLGDGNHDLLSRSYHEVPHHRSERIFLAHFPIRSSPQLVSKVIIGSSARALSTDFTENQSKHWRALLSDPSTSLEMPIKQLSDYAAYYLDDRQQDLINAPLLTSVKKLTYQELVKVDAFERVAAFLNAVKPYFVLQAGGAKVVNQADHRRLLGEVEFARHTVQMLHQQRQMLHTRYRRRFRLAALCVVVLLALVAYLILSNAK